MHVKPFVFFCCAALAVGAATAQTTYRWVDPATGRTVISDQPPPPNVRNVNTSKGEKPDDANVQASYAAKRAAEKFPVVLYTAANCTDHCNNARKLLNNRGVPFEERMMKSEEDVEALKKLVGTEASVPTVTVGSQVIKGFESVGWNNLLDLAGYPKNAAFGSKPSGAFAK